MHRIALVGPSWPFRGGIARTTTSLAASLAGRGSLAAFLTPRRQYPRWLYPGENDADPAACPRLDCAERTCAVLEPWTWPALRRRLSEAHAGGIVMPHWTWAWAPLELRVAAWRLAPLVAVVHNAADHDAHTLARLAGRSVLGRCRGYLCHSQSVADHVLQAYPGRPVAVHPLPPERPVAADRAAARQGLGVRDNAVAFLCFGLIRPYKGVDVALEAMRALPAECPAVLLLAGEAWGEIGAAVRRALADGALARRVIADLRWIPENDVAAWFSAADVALLPYRDSFGSAVAAQALGWGLPVLASSVGALADVVEDDVSGLLAPPGDAAGLAQSIARLCDGDLRRRLAAGARTASRRWSWDSYAQTLETVVGAVVAS